MQILPLLTTSIAVLLVCCEGQGVGKVVINGTAFFFSVSPNPSGILPVYIEVTGGTVLDDVTVNCEGDIFGNGYSNVTFTSLDLTPVTAKGSLAMDLVKSGRAVAVRCWGESLNAGTQFTRDTSMSEDVSVTVLPVPVVDIYSFEVVVEDTPDNQTVTVELSEPVINNPVTVTCSPATSPGSISLTVHSPVQIGVGGQSANMNFQLVDKVGEPVVVTCSATGGQYDPVTSSNSITFRMESRLAALYPQRASVYTGSFRLLLALAGTSELSIGCQATVFNSTDKAEEELSNPTCSAVTSPTPAATDPTATAQTPLASGWRIEEPEFEIRTNQLYWVVEVLRNGETNTPVWEFIVVTCCSRSISNGWKSAMLATVYLQPSVSINWDSVTDTETVIDNPAFVDVSPCPCNLLSGICDLNCCCDNDCNNEDKTLFSACISGLPGGQSPAVPTYSCSSSHFNKVDWFPLMCVEWEYNALLGYYYTSQSAVRSESAFNNYLRGITDYTFRETDELSMEDDSSPDTGYQDGESIKTSGNNYVGTLVFPQPILSSKCAMSPVQYLRNTNTQCSYSMSADLCSRQSVLSAFSYIMSSLYQPAFPNTFSVLHSPDSTTVAPTIVNYHCATDISPYIRGVTASTAQKELPPRCSFDDGYTEPPAPDYVAGVDATCDNAVLGVSYQVLWSGTEIVQLNATIVMGTVPLSQGGEATVLTTNYETEFVHNFQSQENTLQDNYLGSQTSYERSGRRGYVIGKPLYSGTAVLNQAGDFVSIDQLPSQQMAYWLPGVDTFCSSDSRGYIMFGEDSLSGCYIQLGLQNFTNCITLREDVVLMMDSLMSADRLGKDGYNHPDVDTDWIQVLKQNVSEALFSSSGGLADDGLGNQTLLTEFLAGQCSNMISSVHLDIMYAEAGRSNGEAIYEIVGAYRKFAVSNWQLTCDDGFSACAVDDYRENFYLTSSVRFIKVPAQTPTPVIAFEYRTHPAMCWADVCWDNFMYPLNIEYSVDTHQYAVVNSLLLILFIISYLALTQPWW